MILWHNLETGWKLRPSSLLTHSTLTKCILKNTRDVPVDNEREKTELWSSFFFFLFDSSTVQVSCVNVWDSTVSREEERESQNKGRRIIRTWERSRGGGTHTDEMWGSVFERGRGWQKRQRRGWMWKTKRQGEKTGVLNLKRGKEWDPD